MENVEILEKIIEAVQRHKAIDGWTDLALIGKPLNEAGINYKALGYLKLRELIEEFKETLEIKTDSFSYKVPVLYVKVRQKELKTQATTQRATNGAGNTRLMDWAWMGDFRKVVSDLKSLALKERWYYKNQNPAFPYPILSKYLIYTFYRIAKEANKIRSNEQYAAFNTGLVNNLYEPIYALFEKHKLPGKREWYFHEFCISGVDKAGKILAANFNPLPQRAHFFSNPSDLIYDLSAPEPQMNWNHIILDNVSRLPLEFLEENKPAGFLFRDTSTMDTIQRNEYFEQLANAIENDSKKFRAIKNRFSDAMQLALKRVQWNFKTAIPMYYPPNDKMSLLLPLALLDDDVIDLALVTEKTKAGSYLGHTILPLSWAYSNARLVTRPDSDWLVAEEIEPDRMIDSAEVEDPAGG